MGKLVSTVQNLSVTIEKGKFPSYPDPNPKRVHKAGSSSDKQQEETKSLMTLTWRKLFDNKLEVPTQKTSETISSFANPSNDSSQDNLEESSQLPYIPKTHFP